MSKLEECFQSKCEVNKVGHFNYEPTLKEAPTLNTVSHVEFNIIYG